MTYRRQLQGRGQAGRRIDTSVGRVSCIPPAFSASPVATAPTGMLIGETVQTTDGTFVGTGVVVTYQWRRDGVNIGGATLATYVLVAADIGPLIDCEVTLTGTCGVASDDSNDLQGFLAVGMSGFTTGNYYRTAADAEPKGTASGFAVGVVFRQDAALGTEVLFAGGGLTTTGWALWSLAGAIQFRCANGAGAGVASATYAIGVGDVGKVFRVVGVHTGTHLQLFVNGVQVGADAAIVGYTPVNAANRVGIGVRGTATTPFVSGTIIGCVASNATVQNLAAVQAWDAAVQASSACASFGVGTTQRWQVGDAGNPFDATWADDIGAVDMLRTGTLTRSVFAPSFA